jgi:hypothetical protein
VNPPVGLIVAPEIHALDHDRSADRVLPDRGPDHAVSDSDRAGLADIDGFDVHARFDIAAR